MTYPDKEWIIEVLLEAAKRAAFESTAEHPEDIAHAMMNSIEYGASVLDIINKNPQPLRK